MHSATFHFSVVHISLQKHLGYFNHNFRSPQLRQCEEGTIAIKKVSLKFSLRGFSLVILAILSFRRPIWLHPCMALLPQPCSQGAPPGADVYDQRKKQQTSTDMLIYRLSWKEVIGPLKGDTDFTKEKLLNYTLIWIVKHSLNFMCHAHKRNATEVTTTWLK